MSMQMSKENLGQLILSFYFVGTEDWTQVISLAMNTFTLWTISRSLVVFQSSTCVYPILPTLFVNEDAFSLMSIFDNFVKNQVSVATRVYVWIFC